MVLCIQLCCGARPRISDEKVFCSDTIKHPTNVHDCRYDAQISRQLQSISNEIRLSKKIISGGTSLSKAGLPGTEKEMFLQPSILKACNKSHE